MLAHIIKNNLIQSIDHEIIKSPQSSVFSLLPCWPHYCPNHLANIVAYCCYCSSATNGQLNMVNSIHNIRNKQIANQQYNESSLGIATICQTFEPIQK